MHILRQVPWARHSRCRIGTRPIWVLLAFSTFYALALLCFQSISHRDPSSVFFDASRAYNPLYSAHRAEQAERYITSINQSGRHVVNNNEPPLLCLGIATVARRGTQYVRNTVGSFFAGLSEEERDSIFFDLFVAHSDPAKHRIFAEHWLDVLPDRILQYPKDTAEFDQVRAWEEGGWYRNKSIYDYRYLLRDCYDTGAPYVAMVEDDTLAVQGWFGRLLDALATVKVKMNGYPSDQRWLYLRLFYTDELLGWNSEQWTTYLFWSFVVWISLLTMMLATRRRFPTQLEFLTNEMIAAIAFVCIPAMVLLFFLAGKQTMMPLPSGVLEMNKYGCCSQGFVFPRDMVPDVLDKLRIETKGLVDMQIEKIADVGGYVRWAVVPPILQHTGGTSSKGHGFDDNARRTWSFRFEQYPYD
ncbi:hypothetical protein LTR99_001489 [Exophiala xenobiotica]|uniref:Integral membrane protein n=1 Tax=Vermiconidia calcicola TaxID=1690605 RepID=A0AAV9QKQ7_9PEZI|nr:hypothetical protein LTR99_001489 [Exophiala xenobiotica]KAK5543999.1 hypothetical protein LTR25_001614 [Vermiconidia calcicola]KAK5547722.1 hypothetical protein LTR23_002475 [Chaetothyriales sp. CCFEE 6169]KAK5438015.1 hypothetical protein LTR34_001563 [Exophiala xenobiotica]KAK5440064.1 hypothetical protein LTR18_008001 [Exophiala xenobiotica]